MEQAIELQQLHEKLEAFENAMKLSECPYPAKGRPDDDKAYDCWESGNCGCVYGACLSMPSPPKP